MHFESRTLKTNMVIAPPRNKLKVKKEEINVQFLGHFFLIRLLWQVEIPSLLQQLFHLANDID